MNQLMNLITELVKKDITFTVRPMGPQIDVIAFYHISDMDNIQEIRHPVVLDDNTVDHTVYFIRGNDESEDGIQYKWTFGPTPAVAWNWE
ncbi:MAG: hypothetical protein BWY21_01042 [Parcubacteria group bacterium ADurb.Bin216]|nr:MAG: hypothetical protein BWY21_01042 [Parcubacteria group bacterium ADurb.Bin216]